MHLIAISDCPSRMDAWDSKRHSRYGGQDVAAVVVTGVGHGISVRDGFADWEESALLSSSCVMMLSFYVPEALVLSIPGRMKLVRTATLEPSKQSKSPDQSASTSSV